MNKTLMFIGAGKFQLPGIIRAREMGIKTVVIDRDYEAPGLKIADVPLETDILDVESAIKIAKEQKIDGVLTIASDIALPTVSLVADALGLPGIRPEVAMDATNKGRMREKFRLFKVPSPEFRLVNTVLECINACKSIGFPVVIKPVDNAGSRGVSKVSRIEDVNEAYTRAKKFSRVSDILVEKFMDGKEIGVDAIISQNKFYLLSVSDKIRTPPPYLLDTTVIFPSKHSGGNLKNIIDLAKSASIDAISLDNCPLHMEIMMSRKGPQVVELAARGAGFKVFTDILPMITGVDTLEVSIQLCLGLVPDCTLKRKNAAVLHFFKNKPGTLQSINGLNKLPLIDGLVDYDIYVKPGDLIKPLTSGSDRIGHAITVADNRSSALKCMEKVKKTVKLTVSSE